MGALLSKPIRAICDTGAQVSMITNKCAILLGIPQEPTGFKLSGVGGLRIKIAGEASLDIWHRSDNLSIVEGKFIIVNHIIDEQPVFKINNEQSIDINADRMADPKWMLPGPVDALLDVGMWSRIVKNEIKRIDSGLLAQNSSLGWLIFGIGTENNGAVCSSLSIMQNDQNNLENLIKQLWEINEISEVKIMTKEELLCEQIFTDTHYRNNKGRYIVTLPLKQGAILGESRAMALRRLYQLESRFERNPELKKKYVEFMSEYENLGHMKRADKLEMGKAHYYIPHHAVEEKFRVVFDGSAETTNGISLNDIQWLGPKLQGDLLYIVLDFRTGKIAFSADICKMFRQIGVDPSQWDLQRILWRANPWERIIEYWLIVVTYGLKSSMYNAVRALLQCALDHAEEFPRASVVVKKSFFADDLLKSVDSEQDAIGLKRDLIELPNRGGLELAKWKSNSSVIMEEEFVARQFDVLDSASVLGTVWNFDDDTFRIKIKNSEKK